MEDKYLSIITNFGCHYECPYCIVRNNNLYIPHTTVEGLDMARTAFTEHDCNIVSISGGGDPLYNYDIYEDWWDKLLFIIFPKTRIELHTSYTSVPDKIRAHCYRIVYHVGAFPQLENVKRYSDEIVRVVVVVDPTVSKDTIDGIYNYCQENKDNIDELSFRQYVDGDYETHYFHHDYLLNGHKLGKWHYIQQNDYNIYYAENRVLYRYKDFKN